MKISIIFYKWFVITIEQFLAIFLNSTKISLNYYFNWTLLSVHSVKEWSMKFSISITYCESILQSAKRRKTFIFYYFSELCFGESYREAIKESTCMDNMLSYICNVRWSLSRKLMHANKKMFFTLAKLYMHGASLSIACAHDMHMYIYVYVRTLTMQMASDSSARE